MRRLTLRIDDALCWGCMTCEAACKQENRAPDGVKLIWVVEEGPNLVDGTWHFVFRPSRCRHCEEPPCAAVCPVDAITERDDGIVVMDYETCIGCEACIPECPYDAIDFDGDREVAQKCNLCHHRIDQGLLPACADNVCLAHCIHLDEAKRAT